MGIETVLRGFLRSIQTVDNPWVAGIIAVTVIVFGYLIYKQNSGTLKVILQDGVQPHSNYITKLVAFVAVLLALTIVVDTSPKWPILLVIALGMIYAFDRTITYILGQDPS